MSAQVESEVRVDGREVIISRLINAPRAMVFGAWCDKEYLEKWWGPDGFTTTTREMNFTPGGIWRFTMHGPDGTDYPNRIEFREIVQGERITYAQCGDDVIDIHFETTITFEEREGKTLVSLRSLFPSVEALEHVVKNFGAIEGGKQHLSRMDAYLQLKRSGNVA